MATPLGGLARLDRAGLAPAHRTSRPRTQHRKVYRKPLRLGSELRILDCKVFKINALGARQTFTRTSLHNFAEKRNRRPNHNLALIQRLADLCLALSARTPAARWQLPSEGLARLDRAGLAPVRRTDRPRRYTDRKVYRRPLRQGSELRVLNRKAFKINALDARQTFTQRLPEPAPATSQKVGTDCQTTT